MTVERRDLEYGTIQSVTERLAGDELVADVAAGATSLPLADAVDFSEDGGTLILDDTEVVPYLSADLDADTILLSTPTAADYLEGTPVRVYPHAISRRTLVQLDLDGEAVDARVPHALFDRLALGTRDGDGEEVSLALESQEWVLDDVLGREPRVDGSFLDPTTVPDPTVPIEAPASSPALRITGVTNGLVVRSDDVDPGTVIAYHITDTPPLDANGDPLPFTPTAATQLGEPTAATVLVVTELPDGTPLDPDRTYYLRTVASNVMGTAAPGPEATGELNLDTVSELVTATVEAGFLLAGSIQVGQITIHPDTGITIPTAGGGITLPSDGGEAVFSGTINTGSIQVEDHLTINGEANAINGTLLLANVVEAPSQPPEVGWQFPSTTTIGSDTWSLTDSVDGTEWVSILWGTDKVQTFRKTDGVRTRNVDAGDYYLKSITRIGSYYYATAAHRFDNLDLYLVKLDANLNRVTDTRLIGAKYAPKAAAVGQDESGNVIIAYARTDGTTIRVLYRLPGNLQEAKSSSLLDYGDGTMTTAADLTNVHRLPTGPSGAAEWWVGMAGSMFRHSGLTGPQVIVSKPESAKGFHYDGTRVWSLGYSSYKTWKWSSNPWPAPVSVTYTWYDSDPAGSGTHETPASPAYSYQPPPYAYLRVKKPFPADAGDVDSPDTARIYLDDHLQVGGEPWAQYTIYETLDATGAAAPTVNGFDNAASTPGRISSAAQDGVGPLIDLHGDGTARLPGLPPSGSIIMWAGGTQPPGWLLCQGQALSTALYPKLYEAIGFTYGGSGSTFYLPDLRARLPLGANPGADKGAPGDHETGAAGTAPGAGDPTRLDHRHSHSIPAVNSTDGHSKAAGTTTPNVLALRAFDGHNHGGATGNAGVAGGNTQYHAFLTLNFIIKF